MRRVRRPLGRARGRAPHVLRPVCAPSTAARSPPGSRSPSADGSRPFATWGSFRRCSTKRSSQRCPARSRSAIPATRRPAARGGRRAAARGARRGANGRARPQRKPRPPRRAARRAARRRRRVGVELRHRGDRRPARPPRRGDPRRRRADDAAARGRLLRRGHHRRRARRVPRSPGDPAALAREDRRGLGRRFQTCALDLVGAEIVRDVEPGEVVWIDEDGCHTAQAVPRGGSAS